MASEVSVESQRPDSELAALCTIPDFPSHFPGGKPGKGGRGLSQPTDKIWLISQEAKNPGGRKGSEQDGNKMVVQGLTVFVMSRLCPGLQMRNQVLREVTGLA